MSDEKGQGDRHFGKKCYAVVAKESVEMFGEAVGHQDLSEEVLSILSEDVTYRLREMIQASCQFMRHSRRKMLTSEDINMALRNCDVQPVFGHGNLEASTFRQTREGELYFTDDLDINLSSIGCSNHPPHQLGQVTVRAHWVAVEGLQKGAAPVCGLESKVNTKVPRGVSDDLLKYYDNVTTAILGADEEIMKLALTDIHTNPKIATLLPFFVNFVSNGVKTVSHDICQMTKLLHTVHSLISNSSLYLDPKPYLELLVQAIMYCILEPLTASINPLNDHWSLRDYAARLLTDITRVWASPVNGIYKQNIDALREVVYDLGKPFCSHYGAIMALLTFGIQAVEDVLIPHLAIYWPHLQAALEDQNPTNIQIKADAQKVYNSLLLTAEMVILCHSNHILQMTSTNAADPSVRRVTVTPELLKTEPNVSGVKEELPDSNVGNIDLIGTVLQLPELRNPYHNLATLYDLFYEYFGDGLSMRLPYCHIRNYYKVDRREALVSLGDEESCKTGEKLLEQFLSVDSTAASAKPPKLRRSRCSHEGDQDNDADSEAYSFPEDMEFYGDEKSIKSERSEPSSRTDRSHSDESDSSMETDVDNVTVKTVVADSQSIKLKILMRPKLKSESSHVETVTIEDPIKMEEKKLREKKPSLKVEISAVFDQISLQKPRLVITIFRFQGREQHCCNLDYFQGIKQKLYVFDRTQSFENKFHSLSQHFVPYGKMQQVQNKQRRKRLMHLFSASLSSVF